MKDREKDVQIVDVFAMLTVYFMMAVIPTIKLAILYQKHHEPHGDFGRSLRDLDQSNAMKIWSREFKKSLESSKK